MEQSLEQVAGIIKAHFVAESDGMAVIRVRNVSAVNGERRTYQAEVTTYYPGISKVGRATRRWEVTLAKSETYVLDAQPWGIVPLPVLGAGADDHLSRCVSQISAALRDWNTAPSMGLGCGDGFSGKLIRGRLAVILTSFGYTPAEFSQLLQERTTAKFVYLSDLAVENYFQEA